MATPLKIASRCPDAKGNSPPERNIEIVIGYDEYLTITSTDLHTRGAACSRDVDHA